MNDKNNITRCHWVENQPDIYIKYHDEQWGEPVHDDRLLFAKLVLDGAQAGLSWLTILKKRENYFKAFNDFDIEKVAAYDDDKINELMQNSGIVRNKLKIKSAIKNAGVILKIQSEVGSFNEYLWGFVNNKTIHNEFKHASEIPAKTSLSEKISRDMKKRGMSFIGPTIIYAYMQAIGIVNDHTIDCYRYRELLLPRDS